MFVPGLPMTQAERDFVVGREVHEDLSGRKIEILHRAGDPQPWICPSCERERAEILADDLRQHRRDHVSEAFAEGRARRIC